MGTTRNGAYRSVYVTAYLRRGKYVSNPCTIDAANGACRYAIASKGTRPRAYGAATTIHLPESVVPCAAAADNRNASCVLGIL